MLNNTLEGHFLPLFAITSGTGRQVAADVAGFTVQIVNVAFVGDRRGWVLVDAGMPASANMIAGAAEQCFGSGSRPQAIILTHGHFDHVGALVDLVRYWQVPVYAHERELPYLTGRADYPQPDATVEGGAVAKISPIFPHSGINLGSNVSRLPADHSVPGMPGWHWLHTPGHTPGHVSLFRESDRALIAGDAFVTVRQDSMYKVITQQPEVNGPPRYLTPDWGAARESVQKLAALRPAAAITGHGRPMSGEELAKGLEDLINNFDRVAVPDYGKFV